MNHYENEKQPSKQSFVKTFPLSLVGNTIHWIVSKQTLHPSVSLNTFLPENLQVQNNITCQSLTQLSDSKIKKNISDISLQQCESFFKLQPKEFTFIHDFDDKVHYGFIAQEVQTCVPELVHETINNLLSVNYVEMIPFLVKKIQDLEQRLALIEPQIHSQPQPKNTIRSRFFSFFNSKNKNT